MSEHRYALRGDIDLETAPAVRRDLRAIVSSATDDLLVDCTHLTFIDSTGIVALLEAHQDLAAQGRRMLIVNVPKSPRRVFEVLGLDDLLRWEPGVTDRRHRSEPTSIRTRHRSRDFGSTGVEDTRQPS
jgi:anti-sigma B factor antagonist